MKRLLIVRCSDPMRWYAPLVGQTVPLLGQAGAEYRSREPDGYVNFVLARDAQVVEQRGEVDASLFEAMADDLAAEAERVERQARRLRIAERYCRASALRRGEAA